MTAATGEKLFNFSDVQAMILDRDKAAAKLLRQILVEFGTPDPCVLTGAREAETFLCAGSADIAFIALGYKTTEALDLIRKVRKSRAADVRFMPIIAVTAYSRIRDIELARDAGANFVIRKPISPAAIYDRIVWAALSKKDFVDAPSYLGPDRRFRKGDGVSVERRIVGPARYDIVEL